MTEQPTKARRHAGGLPAGHTAVCMLRAELDAFVPEIPDFAYDRHSQEGRRRGRGIEHFLAEGAQLQPAPAGQDPYAVEAVELWFRQEREKQRVS